MNKKILPYIIVGVPILVGVLFLVKAIKNKKANAQENKDTPIEDPKTPTPSPSQGGGYSTNDKLPFKKGMQSNYIESIQKKLGGLTVDGKFGSRTEAKVKEFQKSKLLTADGIVGAITWKTMFGADFPLTYEPQYGGAKPLVELPTKPKDPFFPTF
jgi:peptidoglycan hydrolase-like protein with peptidoglycan-binding domain